MNNETENKNFKILLISGALIAIVGSLIYSSSNTQNVQPVSQVSYKKTIAEAPKQETSEKTAQTTNTDKNEQSRPARPFKELAEQKLDVRASAVLQANDEDSEMDPGNYPDEDPIITSGSGTIVANNTTPSGTNSSDPETEGTGTGVGGVSPTSGSGNSGAGTTSPVSPSATTTPSPGNPTTVRQSTPAVPDTGNTATTYAFIISTLLLGLGGYIIYKNPRKLALNRLEKRITKRL